MISVLFLDCDGILTTGKYLYSDNGKQYKEFSSIDSNGIALAKKKGIRVEVISSDSTGDGINEARCQDIGIPYNRAINLDKKNVAIKRLKSLDKDWSEVASMGDDITDINLLKKSLIPITVPNAIDKVKSLVEDKNGYITERRGGDGAVAEAIRYLVYEREKRL
ncbi:HAD hydrolase family protein [Methanonatronarchaeum sp. AMET6-2]|uniref:HAD hydrolase family protein n=1 Tax=Methanonatronarchaeum sp. AMET6-2 TaxID=2933293 RepID=UPI001FF5C9E9|nr:HAD hydrolase family protein [Methanonatronarchaeum sp. AMET6-2]UOY10285.1 HAD hydrolase family protein [Methanonatronarchaeum sp. AMET6-2]